MAWESGRLSRSNRLAFFHAGLNQRLVGTEGAQPIRELIA